jgi:uncharacterized delta-60 repeat protein
MREDGMKHPLLVLTCALAITPYAWANPGDLDGPFGIGGKVTTPIGAADDVANALLQQADGKLVAAGDSTNPTDFALARYNTDGSLDGSFGTGGKVTTPIGTAGSSANALVQQADGKLVAAGSSYNGTDDDFALARYNADGSLDGSFGTGGKVTTSISGDDIAYALVQQADGKLVAAGIASVGGHFELALARYNAGGSLDGGFGTGGKVTTPIGGLNDEALALVQQADGKLVAAGFSYNGTDDDFALARYNTDGSLDGSFGTGGKVTTPITGNDDHASALVQQADGKLVAAGEGDVCCNNIVQGDFALVRYDADGSPDGAFGTGGIVTTSISGNDHASALVQQVDGKFVAAGYSRDGGQYDFALARYNTDGSLDATFGMGGKVTTPIGAADDFALALVQQADGKLVAGGSSSNGTDYDFALARYCGDATMCTPVTTCAPTLASGCHVAAAAKSSILIVDNADSTKRLFKWKWKGAAMDTTAVGEFKDPLNGTPSLLACVYDASGNLQPVTQAQIFPGGTCAGKPCWKLLGKVAAPTGYKYQNKAATPAGLTDAKLQAGADGKAQVGLKGKGSLLQNPTLGLTVPVTVQFLIRDGTGTACWQTAYSTAQVNMATKFSAKGP